MQNWEQVANVAWRHQVVPLVAAALRRAGVTLSDRLARLDGQARQRAMGHAGEALRLDGALRAAGLSPLFIKGSTLAQRCFGSVVLRQFADIDLLVAPHKVPAAWVALNQLGYSRQNTPNAISGDRLDLVLAVAKDSIHVHAKHAIVVELHWRLSDEMRDARAPPPEQWQRVEITPGRTLATLSDEALFTYLCVHGAQHVWARLKWLADVAALLRSCEDGGARCLKAASAAGARLPAASAVLLCGSLFGVAPPPGFAQPRSLRLHLLNALAMRALIAGGGTTELAHTRWRGWAEMAAKMLIVSDVGSWLTLVRRVAISRGDVEVLLLPAPLWFLYPIVRIPSLILTRVRRRRDLAGTATQQIPSI